MPEETLSLRNPGYETINNNLFTGNLLRAQRTPDGHPASSFFFFLEIKYIFSQEKSHLCTYRMVLVPALCLLPVILRYRQKCKKIIHFL